MLRTVQLSVSSRAHRVDVEAPGPLVPDGEGGWTQSWELLAAGVWASIEPASQVDLQRLTGSSTVQAIASHVIALPWLAVGLDARVVWRRMPTRPDRFFLIQSVQNVDEREIRLVLVCVEVVGGPPLPPSRAAEGADDGEVSLGRDAGAGRSGESAPAAAGGPDDGGDRDRAESR